jgi:hypothetical protein
MTASLSDERGSAFQPSRLACSGRGLFLKGSLHGAHQLGFLREDVALF